MSFRFWKRIKIAPGVTVNLSKSGASLSFGPRGAKYTLGGGGARTTVGIPGTGLFYTKTSGSGKKSGKRSDTDAPTVRPEDRLSLGFFKRLLTPDDEEGFVDGCRELVLGHEDRALDHFRHVVHLADAAYLAGFLALKRRQLDEAEDYFSVAVEKNLKLGRYFSKYGMSAVMSLPIAEDICVHVGPDLKGTLLGLTEVYQHQDRTHDALKCLEKLHHLEPNDAVVMLSLAELLMEAYPENNKICRKVIRFIGYIKNETPVHAALLLYKARALKQLELLSAARDVLTTALRRKKGRSPELLKTIRYERALVYDKIGKKYKARSEFEKIYSDDPDYEDVADRLGL